MAKAAKRVIVTCEEVVPRAEVVASAHMTKLPGYYVTAVIEAPFGAHPTSHVPRYSSDPWQLLEYATAAGGEAFKGYVDRLAGETESGYRERVLGQGRGDVLRALAERAQPLSAVAEP
jgi:glutaconate CoA-transferase subunit A